MKWGYGSGVLAAVLAGVSVQLATVAYAGSAVVDDKNDMSIPELVGQAPTWMEHENTEIERPVNLSSEQQEECVENILDYVNVTFHTEFTEENLAPIQMPSWSDPEVGFVRGGGYNIRIVGAQPTGEGVKEVRPLRSESLIGYVELGIHPSLHIPGSVDGQQTFTEQSRADGEKDLDFIAHIDSADPYVAPFGSLYHFFRDVIGASGRNPCPRNG